MQPDFSTCDLCDAFPDICQSCATQFRQYGGRSGGATVAPGHWIYGDEDGIIVSTRELS